MKDSQDMSDKENNPHPDNNTATFNPYKRINRIALTHEKPQIESIDLNIKDFDRVRFPFRDHDVDKNE